MSLRCLGQLKTRGRAISVMPFAQHGLKMSTSNKNSSFFAGKHALVTGGASGIGRAIVHALHEEGACVKALDRNEPALARLEADLPGVVGLHADLAGRPDDVFTALQKAGPIELLVNSAAITILEPFLQVTMENFRKLMQVNVEGMLLVSQYIARDMVARGGGGAILNMSSLASMVAVPSHTSYCTSKGAVDALTRMMALELGPHGIKVNSLNPTLVNSGMGKLAFSDPQAIAPIKARISLGRLVEEEDVVKAALFLLSTDMVHGHSLPLDGGTLVRLV